MKELLNLKKDIIFSNNIAEISSISLECNYEGVENIVKGQFLVEGSYRSHELSLNKENFNYKIPFEYEFKNNIIQESINLNIKDFTYQIDADTLSIEIEYEVEAEEDIDEEEFLEQEAFDRFLQEHEVDVVDLNEDNEVRLIEEIHEDILPSENIENKKIIEEEMESSLEPKEIEDTRNIQETVINTASMKEDNYITYHVYVCEEDDTLDRIANKYNVTLDEIKEYNDIETITYGMKIIIPFKDE